MSWQKRCKIRLFLSYFSGGGEIHFHFSTFPGGMQGGWSGAEHLPFWLCLHSHCPGKNGEEQGKLWCLTPACIFAGVEKSRCPGLPILGVLQECGPVTADGAAEGLGGGACLHGAWEGR